MSHDMKPTRRAIVAGATAMPAVAALPAIAGAAQPDPIFAAIAAHRTAWAAVDAAAIRLDDEGAPQEKEEAELRPLSDVEDEAQTALIDTEPTTMAGVVALLRHLAAHDASGLELIGEYHDDGDPAVSKTHGASASYFFHRNLANAIERLAVVS
jgi:hypothetical protein